MDIWSSDHVANSIERATPGPCGTWTQAVHSRPPAIPEVAPSKADFVPGQEAAITILMNGGGSGTIETWIDESLKYVEETLRKKVVLQSGQHGDVDSYIEVERDTIPVPECTPGGSPLITPLDNVCSRLNLNSEKGLAVKVLTVLFWLESFEPQLSRSDQVVVRVKLSSLLPT